MSAPSRDEVELIGFLRLFWHRKWLILGLTLLGTIVAAAWALTATEWYRADVVLAPATDGAQGPANPQLAGLVAITGLGSAGARSAEAVAVLRSREFLHAFVEENGLAPQFEQRLGKPVESHDVVAELRERLLRIQDSAATGLVTVSLEWTDPVLAAEWTNQLVAALNATMRERMLREAEANVSYLQGELAATTVVTLQQAVGRLLESELQKLMVARGSEEAAFRVLDRAAPPRRPVRPQQLVMVIMGASLGFILSVLWVSVSAALRD